MHALLACAVVTWLGMPICAAESPSGGDSRVETGDTIFLNRKMKSAFAETRQHMGVVGSVAPEILAAVRAGKAFNVSDR